MDYGKMRSDAFLSLFCPIIHDSAFVIMESNKKFQYAGAVEALRANRGFFPIYASFALLLISAAAYGGLYYLNNAQSVSRDTLAEQITLKEEDLQPKVIDQIVALASRLQNAQQVLSAHPFTQNVFSLLERDTHPNARFSNFSYDPQTNTVQAAGEAGDYGVIARQIAFFEGDPHVDSVEFGGLNIDDKGNVRFTMALKLTPALAYTRP